MEEDFRHSIFKSNKWRSWWAFKIISSIVLIIVFNSAYFLYETYKKYDEINFSMNLLSIKGIWILLLATPFICTFILLTLLWIVSIFPNSMYYGRMISIGLNALLGIFVGLNPPGIMLIGIFFIISMIEVFKLKLSDRILWKEYLNFTFRQISFPWQLRSIIFPFIFTYILHLPLIWLVIIYQNLNLPSWLRHELFYGLSMVSLCILAIFILLLSRSFYISHLANHLYTISSNLVSNDRIWRNHLPRIFGRIALLSGLLGGFMIFVNFLMVTFMINLYIIAMLLPFNLHHFVYTVIVDMPLLSMIRGDLKLAGLKTISGNYTIMTFSVALIASSLGYLLFRDILIEPLSVRIAMSLGLQCVIFGELVMAPYRASLSILLIGVSEVPDLMLAKEEWLFPYLIE